MEQIDFKGTKIFELFFKMFIPTLLGMVFVTSLVVCDGIFVGRGIGSDALAAVNISMPLFMIATGIGLMFGMGASVIASLYLAKNRIQKANYYLTQSLFVSVLFILLLSALIIIFDEQVARLLGGSDRLIPLAMDYMHVFIPFVFLEIILIIGQFIIRLDGSPNYAMLCTVVAAFINIILDYIFIFLFDWGLSGAAWASVIGMMAGVILFLLYTFKYSRTFHFQFVTRSPACLRSLIQTISNVVKMGFPALLGEIAISIMFLMGNNAFIRMLGEDGVAAFSVACYLFSFVFMVAIAIVESSQPIISFNFGTRDYRRVLITLRLSLAVALFFSVIVSIFLLFFRSQVVSLFLVKTTHAHEIAVFGIPYFATGFIFFTLNMVLIGYYQSIGHALSAGSFIILRGIILMAACFIVLPFLFGDKGIWMAIPVSELLSFLSITLFYLCTEMKYIANNHLCLNR
jgi:putative MATE family efflux protein